jgi:hypothetical protein
MRTLTSCSLLSVIVILISCNQHSETDNSSKLKSANILSPFIKPPLPAANVPFKNYTFLAEQGDTILYKSGSIILFPKNSLVDKDGNIIKGKVDVQYREFANPLDFYLSGIPMQYDSAGIKYTFESAGMCEINAFQNGNPVFVNPNAKPQINLASHNTDPVFNLYQLDTAQRKWINRGKDTITDFSHAPATNNNSGTSLSTADNAPLVCPIKPMKAWDKNPIIDVTVDPASFQELMAYNNLKFEIIDTKNINTSDTLEEW